MPLTKRALLDAEAVGCVRDYGVAPWPPSHANTNYSTWRRTESGTFPVNYIDEWEPYYAGAIGDLVPYNELLRGPSLDKAVHSFTMAALQTKFVVLASGFLLHGQRLKQNRAAAFRDGSEPHYATRLWTGGLSWRDVLVRNTALFEKVIQPQTRLLAAETAHVRLLRRRRRRTAQRAEIAKALFMTGPKGACLHQLRTSSDWAEVFTAHECLQSLMIQDKIESRYVVAAVNGESGLGNRLLALVSAYLLAIVSERGLLIHWPSKTGASSHSISGETHSMSTMSGLFDIDAVLPGILDTKDLLGGVEFSSNFLNTAPVGSACTICGPISADHINISPMDLDKWRQLMCGDVNEIYPQKYIVLDDVWDYFAVLLQANPHYADRLKMLSEAPLFSTLAKTLLRPAESLQQTIDVFKRRHFADRYVVGMHVRRIGMNLIGMSGDTDIMHHFHAAAHDLARKHNVRKLPVSFFIITDNATVLPFAARVFQNDTYFFSPVASTSGRATASAHRASVIELWLLGESDQVLQSDGSTFSGFGAWRKDHLPYVVATDGMPYAPLLREPCYYFYTSVMSHSRCDANEVPILTEGADRPLHSSSGQGMCQLLSPQHLQYESSALAHKLQGAKAIDVVPWALRQSLQTLLRAH